MDETWRTASNTGIQVYIGNETPVQTDEGLQRGDCHL